MALGRGPEAQLAAYEDGMENAGVGSVVPAVVRVVLDEDVTGMDVFAEEVDEVLERVHDGVGHLRQALLLAEDPRPLVEHRGAEVLHLEQRRPRCPLEYERHLLGDGLDLLAEDDRQDRIDVSGSRALGPRLRHEAL